MEKEETLRTWIVTFACWDWGYWIPIAWSFLAGRGCRYQAPLPRGFCCHLTEKMLHSWPLLSSRCVPIIPPCLLGNDQSQVWAQLQWVRKCTQSMCQRTYRNWQMCQQRCEGVDLEGVRLSWLPGAGLSSLLRQLVDIEAGWWPKTDRAEMLEYVWHNVEERVRLKESGTLELIFYVKPEYCPLFNVSWKRLEDTSFWRQWECPS